MISSPYPHNDAATVLRINEGFLENSEGTPCVLKDASNAQVVDSEAYYSSHPEWGEIIQLSIALGNVPNGWSETSNYYAECTPPSSTVLQTNTFKFAPSPKIVDVEQSGNIINVYFTPSLDTYLPETPAFSNPYFALQSDNWFDQLGMADQELNNCQPNVLHESEIVSLCQFDLNVNPQLPSTSNARVLLSFGDSSPYGQIEYFSGSTDTFSIISIMPELTSIPDLTITAGENYTASGSFTDINSSSFSAIIDYGEGNGYEPFVLDGNNFTINHQYNTAGTYLLQLSIQDDYGVYGSTFATITVEEASGPNEPVTLYPTQDAYIMQGSKNENEGGSEILRLQSSGKNRAIIQFDQNEIEEAIGDSQNFSVKLVYTITDNGNNWGNEGRTIDLHRLTGEWLEGNGNGSYRGEGSGATWNCGIDDNINNQANDCSSSWEMTNESEWPFINNPSSATLIENNQEGEVQLDVTSDIQGFINNSYTNYGWLLKKTNEGQNGKVEFGSRETSNSPRLVISFE